MITLMVLCSISLAAAGIIAAVIGAIGGGISAAANYNQNKENMNAQAEANEANLKMQYDINQQNLENSWKMWNATNLYNKPVNQMKRFEEAGLNPNLIYGQTNTASNVSIPSAQAPSVNPVLSQMDFSKVGDIFKDLSKLPFLKEQIKNMELQNEVLERQKQSLILDNQIKEPKWAQSNFELQLWENLRNDPDLFQKYYTTWVNGLIAKNESPGIQNEYRKTITSVQGVIKEIKQIENINSSDFWELKLNAMRIANQIDTVDLDWKEFEKTIASANGTTKILLSLIKMFINKR